MNEGLITSVPVAKAEDREERAISLQEQGLESPEALRQQIAQESQTETEDFKKEGIDQYASIEERAQREGLTIDLEDKNTLDTLDGEADSAQAKLLNEIGVAEKLDEKEAAKVIKGGQEKIHALFSNEQQGSSEYAELSSLLMTQTNGVNGWKSAGEINAIDVQNVLTRIEQEETLFAQREWARQENEKDARAQELRDKAWEAVDSSVQKIDDSLFKGAMGEEGYKSFIEGIRNLPPNELVHLYHGLNSGGFESVLGILNSPSHGVEQHSGPTLSLVPVGQFWKGLGFRYSLRREQISFPGEENPNAVVKMGENGVPEDTGYITTPSGSLPLDQFEAEIMRSQFADPNPALEKEMAEKLQQFAGTRAAQAASGRQ